MTNTILFIGNGFDLALNLKTSYKDFINSPFWPLLDKKFPSKSDGSLEWEIFSFTEKYRDKETGLVRWIDLENVIYKYAKRLKENNPISISSEIVDRNKLFLNILKKAFSEYIRNIVNVSIDPKVNKASKEICSIFKGILEMDSSTVIYSFNYTDTSNIFTKYFNWSNPNVTHMHGRINELTSNIILGINDRNIVDKSHRFLLKSHQEGFGSNSLFDDLHESQNIIFYGMSFGSNDIDYFKDFFNSIILMEDKRKYRKNIFIFTKDEESIASIKSFFEDADVSVRDLYLHANLHFYKASSFTTEEKENSHLSSFLKFCQDNKPLFVSGII